MAVARLRTLITVLLVVLSSPRAGCDVTRLTSLTRHLEAFVKTFEGKLSALESNLTASLDEKSQSSNETNSRFDAVEKALASDRNQTDRRLVAMETRLRQLQEMLERSGDSAARLSVLEEALSEVKASLPPRDLSSAPLNDRTVEERKEEGDEEGRAVQCRYRYQFQFQNIPSSQTLNLPGEADHRLSKLEKEVTNLQAAMSRTAQTVKKTEEDFEERIRSFGNSLEAVLNSIQQSARHLEETMHARFNAVMDTLHEGNATGEAKATRILQRLEGLQDLLLSRLNETDEVVAFVREAMLQRGMEEEEQEEKEEEEQPQARRTCKEHYQHGGNQSGVYTLDLGDGFPAFQVFCRMDGQDAWVAIQRRQDGSVNFRRNWETYANGFGNLTSEFWLGNAKIHRLTKAGLVQLRVDIRDFKRRRAYAVYDNFTVEDVDTNFHLHVSGYHGNAGDSLTYNSGFGFTTYDRDNDVRSSNRKCVDQDHGGWWYRNCAWANLNGLYPDIPSRRKEAYVTWYHWRSTWEPLTYVEMKLREPSK